MFKITIVFSTNNFMLARKVNRSNRIRSRSRSRFGKFCSDFTTLELGRCTGTGPKAIELAKIAVLFSFLIEN